jgi:hypothetical protein
MARGIEARLSRLESDFPPDDPSDFGADDRRLVRILVQNPDGTTDPDVREMTEAEAEERGMIWIPDSDDRPSPEDLPE